METKVVAFPKQKSAKAPKTDAEYVADIKAAQRKLARAIDAAHEAGLHVELRIDAQDQYGGYGAPMRVRAIDPRITRKLS